MTICLLGRKQNFAYRSAPLQTSEVGRVEFIVPPADVRNSLTSLREHAALVQSLHSSPRKSSRSLAAWAKGGVLQLHQSSEFSLYMPCISWLTYAWSSANVRRDLDVARTRDLRILALTHNLSKGYQLFALIQL